MTPNEFRLKVLCHAATSYSMAHPTDPTARHVERASQLADECVREAARLNLFGAVDVMPHAPVAQSAVAQPETSQPIMAPPLQGFAQQPDASPIVQAAAPTAQEVAPTAPLAPQAAAPQVPMQPLPQSNAPQMQMHSSMQPIPQMPVQAAMQNVSPATQVPMSGVAAAAGAGNVGVPAGNGGGGGAYGVGVGNGAIPAVVPPQMMPAAPPQVAPMNVPATGADFQPFGPHGPRIPLPPMPQQPQQQQQQAAPQQAQPTHGQPAQQPGTPVAGAPGLFVPPQTMGGTNTVTQAPLPENFSALGSIGVQEKVEQRPMAQGPIVAPGNQSVVPGGSMPTVVGEKITH